MNRDDIFRFLGGLMSDEEKISFEERLNKSPMLQKEFNDVKNILREFKENDSIEVKEDYFNNILPRFREKLEKKKSFTLVPKYAAGFAIVILLALTAIFILNEKEVDESAIAVNDEYNYEAVDDYLKSYSTLSSTIISDSIYNEDVIDSLIADELNLQEHSLEYAVSSYLPAEVYSYSNEEAEIIYHELLNKKIL